MNGTAHTSSAFVAALAGVILICAPAHTRADVDFAGSAESWNGVGYLIETAREARVTLKPAGTIDLATFFPGDLLVAVQPALRAPPADVRRFVEAGGHLVVATEGAAAAPLLRVFGLEIVESPTIPASADGPGVMTVPAPQGTGARPGAGTRDVASFLFFNVTDLTVNYPSALRVIDGRARSVLPFPNSPDLHLVVEVRLGQGSALFVADASIFINLMQRRHYGNKQFAANVLRFYCDREPCAATLLTDGGAIDGMFNEELARFGPWQRDVAATVASIDRQVPIVSQEIFGDVWLPLALLLALALLGPLRFIARRARQHRIANERRVSHPPATTPAPPLELALGFAAHRGEAEFGPLALSLAELALARHHRHAPLSQTPPPIVASAIDRLTRDAEMLRARDGQGISAETFVRIRGDVETVIDAHRPRRAPAPVSPKG